jgi:hypothetical protein
MAGGAELSFREYSEAALKEQNFEESALAFETVRCRVESVKCIIV